MKAHPPPGSRIVYRGSSVAPDRNGSRSRTEGVVFGFPTAQTIFSTVWLSVVVARAREGGTAIRSDAVVVWVRPRPADEHVPSNVTVAEVRGRDERHHIRFTTIIRAPSTLRKLVAVIEGLRRPSDAASSCPANTGRDPIVTIAFRGTENSRALARVRIDDNGCGSVRFWSGGRQLPELGEARQVTAKLAALLRRNI